MIPFPSMKNPSFRFFLSSGFVLPTASAALFFFVFHSFLLLPLRIQELGGGPSETGFIMGISGVSMLLFTPLSGAMADRFGRKIFIVAGFAALFLTCAGFVFLTALDWTVYALRMLQGAAFSLFFTAAGAVVTETAPEGNKVQAMGIYGMFTIVGYAVAPYIGKHVVDLAGFSTLFSLVSLVCFFGIILSLFVRDTFSAERDDSAPPGFLPPFSAPLVICGAVLFVSGWVFLSQFSFVSLTARAAGVEDFYIFFVSFTGAVLFVRIFLGWIPDRYGIGFVCPPFLLLASLSVFALSVSHVPYMLASSGALFGISHGFTYPSLYLLAMEHSGGGAKAKVFAFCSACFTGGGMLGTFASGIVADMAGYSAMYAALAAVSFAGFAGFVRARPLLTSLPRNAKLI